MDLTDAIRQYAEEKLSDLEKFHDNIIHIEVDLGRNTNHHQKGDVFFCTVMVDVPQHQFRVEKSEEELYKAIDKVRNHLQQEIIRWKERQQGVRRSSIE